MKKINPAVSAIVKLLVSTAIVFLLFYIEQNLFFLGLFRGQSNGFFRYLAAAVCTK